MPREQGSQSGNVFFAMFGAVGLIGILGASMMTIMKGPVRGMQRVTKYTVAENNMIAAGRLALVAAAQQDGGGDCDGDGYVEPVPFADTGTGSAPGGGGILPASVGATRQDPWGNTYGYCVWDHGDEIDNAGCGGAEQNRLSGSTDETNIALAIVSSGPDKVFQTTCADDDTYITKPSGSDDIVLQYTYAESRTLAGGLWNEKAGEPTIAEIGKDLEVKDSGGDVIFGVDSATDPTKPSIKTDFISKLSVAATGVTFLSNLIMDGSARIGIGIEPEAPLHVNGKAIVGREGVAGTYNSSQVQGIWSIGNAYVVDTATNNFGSQYGIVYAHTNSGTGVGSKLPISGWGHQILFTSNGTPTAAIGLTGGNGYFAGKLGIGDSNVDSTTGIQTNSAGPALYLNQPSAGDIYIRYHVPAVRWWTIGPKANGDFWFSNSSDHSGSVPFAIKNNGNVGIGTETPSSQLHIANTGDVILTLEADTDNVTETDNPRIVMSQDGGAVVGRFGFTDGSNSLEIVNQYSDSLILGTNNSPKMLIASSGNVGIDNTSPSHTLTVGDGTGSSRVRIDYGASYDVWLQGGSSISGGDARNLALLGHKSSDRLYVNYGSEYTGGTTIGGPVTLSGDVTVSGTYTGAGDNLGSGGSTGGTLYSNTGTYGYVGQDSNNLFRFQNGYMYTQLGGEWAYRTDETYFSPYTSGGANLGSTSYRWGNAYIFDAFATGGFYSNGGTYGYFGLDSSNYHRFQDSLILTRLGNAYQYRTATNYFAPYSSGGASLGHSSYKWNNIYFSGNATTGGSYLGAELDVTGNAAAGTYYSNAIYGYFGSSGSDYMRFSSGNIYWRNGGAWAYQMTGTHFLPYVDRGASLGTSGKNWDQVNAYTVYADTYVNKSDRRLKDDITTILKPFDLLDGIHGSSFIWKKDGKKAYGVIAQDVQTVMPEAVVANDQGVLMVNYDELIAPLIEAAKQLKTETDALREQDALQAAAIAKLTADNHMLRRQIAGLELPANDNEETEVPKRANQSRR